ncbi:MAG: HD domain-containing protein [Pseudobutyrivibrio sp.]|nr:HD domain-containing protein [Pseudobutyrivibrio sp.]
MNIGGAVVFVLLGKYTRSQKLKNEIPIYLMAYIGIVLGVTHYLYPVLFLVGLIPLFLSTVFEDRKLLRNIGAIEIFAQFLIMDWVVFYAAERFNSDIRYMYPQTIISVAMYVVAYYCAVKMLNLALEKKGGEIEEAKQARTERMSLQMITTLAGTIDAKDPYTNGHSTRVAMYSREIARRAGKGDSYLQNIYYIGLLHDIGKIGVPDSILGKQGKLDKAEYDVIKLHTTIGSEILSEITEIPMLSVGARSHHERYGGGGYPDGLAGLDIPEEARIICVADAYDAMSSDRSYRSALTQEKIIEEIEKGKGGQFDPYFADIMLDMIKEDNEYAMRGKSDDDLVGIIQLRNMLGVDSGKGAFNTGFGGFTEMYHFFRRYAIRNKLRMQLVLINLIDKNDAYAPSETEGYMGLLEHIISNSIRNTDVEARLGINQYMIILTNVEDSDSPKIIDRIHEAWHTMSGNNSLSISFEVQEINADNIQKEKV